MTKSANDEVKEKKGISSPVFRSRRSRRKLSGLNDSRSKKKLCFEQSSNNIKAGNDSYTDLFNDSLINNLDFDQLNKIDKCTEATPIKDNTVNESSLSVKHKELQLGSLQSIEPKFDPHSNSTPKDISKSKDALEKTSFGNLSDSLDLFADEFLEPQNIDIIKVNNTIKKKNDLVNSPELSIKRESNASCSSTLSNKTNGSNEDINTSYTPTSLLNLSLASNDSTQGSQPLLARLKNKLSSSDALFENIVDLKTFSQQRTEIVQKVIEESKNNKEFVLGPFYGLPSKVPQILNQHRGIAKLYQWQNDCIKAGIDSKNLLLSLPTSGGKTLVAEILILRQLLLFKRDVIFILPYVALVQEKVRGLTAFGIDLGFLIEEYAGSKGAFPPKKRRKKHVVYVCTIEKASGLVNSLLETERIEELGLVVVDEAHMIGENGGRGAILETTITKIKYAADHVHLLGMSATIGNLKELGEFFAAQLFTGNHRPVDLKEYVKLENHIAEINSNAHTEDELLLNQKLCAFPYTNEQKKLDSDMVCGLIREVLPDHSCLVFCPTKSNCENLSSLICNFLDKKFTEHRRDDKHALYKALTVEGGGTICPILRKTVPYGIAYHHSGLTDGERRLLEEAYLSGTLCCLTCTSTLAAGINLPARRVIIRAPYIGREFLTRSRYQQMIGRAGRAGFDTCGESYMVIQNRDIKRVGELLLSPIELCRSTLKEDQNKGLISLIFSSLGLNIIKCITDMFKLVRCSLLFLQNKEKETEIDQTIVDIIEDLRIKALVRIKISSTVSEGSQDTAESLSSEKDSQYMKELVKEVLSQPAKYDDHLAISRLGRAAIKGCVDLSLAKQLYKDLTAARESLAVHCHLHLLYLVTPYSAVQLFTFQPKIFYEAFMKLGPEEMKVGELLGITEGIVVMLSIGQKPKKLDMSIIHRFYIALLLHDLLQGHCIWKVSRDFNIHRGLAQHTLASAAAFSCCVYGFCQELEELWAFRDLLSTFSKHLSGCSSDILPLLDIPAVKIGRAKMLHKAGYKSVQDIARASPADLVKSVEHLSNAIAKQIINSAKMIVLEKFESLQEEAEEVLLGLQS